MAIVPAWLLLDISEKLIKIDAEKIGIYHIGLNDNVQITGDKVVIFEVYSQQVSLF